MVDGTDEPIRGGRIEFPSGPVRRPRRPIAGIGIALVTALVTMGAMGPRPPDPQAPALAGCPPEANAAVAQDTVPLGPRAIDGSTPAPWWTLPHVRVWVDPATGRTRQGAADPLRRVVDHRHLDR